MATLVNKDFGQSRRTGRRHVCAPASGDGVLFIRRSNWGRVDRTSRRLSPLALQSAAARSYLRAGVLIGSDKGAAANEAAMRSAGGSRYKVVRCFGVRPSERTSPSMFSGGISWPKLAPAAREMLSFINVPPMSLQPASRQAAAPSGPSFTQEH